MCLLILKAQTTVLVPLLASVIRTLPLLHGDWLSSILLAPHCPYLTFYWPGVERTPMAEVVHPSHVKEDWTGRDARSGIRVGSGLCVIPKVLCHCIFSWQYRRHKRRVWSTHYGRRAERMEIEREVKKVGYPAFTDRPQYTRIRWRPGRGARVVAGGVKHLRYRKEIHLHSPSWCNIFEKQLRLFASFNKTECPESRLYCHYLQCSSYCFSFNTAAVAVKGRCETRHLF